MLYGTVQHSKIVEEQAQAARYEAIDGGFIGAVNIGLDGESILELFCIKPYNPQACL